MSQSPSLRGSGRFTPSPIRAQRRGVVSIPFIAGQWSLRGGKPPGEGGAGCLNPLHCGAVVASVWRARQEAEAREVSIPFIAGQWSLRLCYGSGLPRVGKFQSPSLRGSGRFQGGKQNKWDHSCSFQSPSLRGSGRFRRFIWLDNFGSRAFQSPSLRGSGRFTFHTRCFK